MMRLRSCRSSTTPAMGPASIGRNRTREHDAGDHEPGVCIVQGEAEDGDIVEVVADLADDLADPCVAIVGVSLAKDARKSGI